MLERLKEAILILFVGGILLSGFKVVFDNLLVNMVDTIPGITEFESFVMHAYPWSMLALLLFALFILFRKKSNEN